MAVTDQDQLSEVQLVMLEVPDNGVTWNSELWTAAEVLAYFNQRQNRFVKDTLLFVATDELQVPAGTVRPALPSEWVATIDKAWQDSASGTWYPLSPGNSLEYDRGLPSWRATPGVPQAYMDEETPTLTTQLAPVPAADGVLETMYVGLAGLLDGAGEIFTVPDEFVPYIKYGVLADMLGKVGRGKDSFRAAYCESRYLEGVNLAQLYMLGMA